MDPEKTRLAGSSAAPLRSVVPTQIVTTTEVDCDHSTKQVFESTFQGSDKQISWSAPDHRGAAHVEQPFPVSNHY